MTNIKFQVFILWKIKEKMIKYDAWCIFRDNAYIKGHKYMGPTLHDPLYINTLLLAYNVMMWSLTTPQLSDSKQFSAKEQTGAMRPVFVTTSSVLHFYCGFDPLFFYILVFAHVFLVKSMAIKQKTK